MNPQNRGIYLVPLLPLGRDKPLYWWTLSPTAPYRVGQKGVDWDGPFANEDHAIKCARETLKKAPFPDGAGHYFECLDTIALPYEGFQANFNIKLAFPLDEYTERVYYGKGTPVEYQFFRNMNSDVDIISGQPEPEFWVTGTDDYYDDLERYVISNSEIEFVLPITLYYWAREPIADLSLQSALEVKVWFDDQFPEISSYSLETVAF